MDIYELAKELYGLGSFLEANTYAVKALEYKKELFGNNSIELVDCLILIANILAKSAKYEDALNILQTARTITEGLESYALLIKILISVGDINVKLAKYDMARDPYHSALELSRFHCGPTSREVALVYNSIGILEKKCSDYDKALASCMDSLNIISEDDSIWTEIATNLADVYRKKGFYTDSRELYLKVLSKLESKYGDNHPEIAEVCNALGMLSKKEGNYNEALKCYKNALRIAKHLYGKDHPNIGIYLNNIGDIHRKEGDYKKAETIYNQAIQILTKTLGPNHIEVAEVYNSMGLVKKKKGDYDGAEVLYNAALVIVIKTFGDKHYKAGIYLNNLGDVERKRGNYSKALDIYNRALAAIEASLGATHSEAAEIFHNIGLVQHQLGNYQEALKYITSALQIVKKEFGESHYKVGMFTNSLGLTRSMLNEHDEAYKELKQALQILLLCLGSDHIEVADCYMALGDVCMKQHVESVNQEGKLEEAKKYYTNANKIVINTLGPDHSKSIQLSSLIFVCENYSTLNM